MWQRDVAVSVYVVMCVVAAVGVTLRGWRGSEGGLVDKGESTHACEYVVCCVSCLNRHNMLADLDTVCSLL